MAAGRWWCRASQSPKLRVRAEMPPDLSARPTDLALDVWKVAMLRADEPATRVVDVGPADSYQRYHVPGAANMPGASASQIKDQLRAAPAVVVYADKDEAAEKVVAEVKRSQPGARLYYLADGARAWYLALQLPVPLFAEAAAPSGYADAIQVVNGWSANAASAPRPKVIEAIQTLAKLNYQPTLLSAGKKRAAAGGGKKKIAGGCG